MRSEQAVQQIVEEALSSTYSTSNNRVEIASLLENDQVSSWIGSQIVSFISGGDGQQLMNDLQGIVEYVEAALTRYTEITERNVELAAALGACACWGEHEQCDVCHGAGAPGWVQPDRDLFSIFVVPALLSVRGSRAPQINYDRERRGDK